MLLVNFSDYQCIWNLHSHGTGNRMSNCVCAGETAILFWSGFSDLDPRWSGWPRRQTQTVLEL